MVNDLHKPNLLHTMQIGMFDCLQQWILHFMKTHERLDKNNANWVSVSGTHNLILQHMSYEEVSQWNGKKMTQMSTQLFGVVTQSLRGRSPAQHPIFNGSLEYT
jgi:hypothetical protein